MKDNRDGIKMRMPTTLLGAHLMPHTKGKVAVFPPLCKSREGLEYWPKARVQSEVFEHLGTVAAAPTATAERRIIAENICNIS